MSESNGWRDALESAGQGMTVIGALWILARKVGGPLFGAAVRAEERATTEAVEGMRTELTTTQVTVWRQTEVYTDEQIATLATIPTLVVLGDHLDAVPLWTNAFADCHTSC